MARSVRTLVSLKSIAWACAVGVFALALGIVCRLSERASVAMPPPPPPPVARVDLIGPDADAVGQRMRADGDVANDVVFLVIAALRARCVPARAHDLPQMAVTAHLPVLRPESDAARKTTGNVVRDVVRRASCDAAFVLRIGPYSHAIDPARYVTGFPDSYFDPDLDVVPDEFAGASLDVRAADDCSRVAYAVLPLDVSREWQCAGVRADARKRIRALCRSEGTEADQAAMAIRDRADRLPATCR